MRLCSDCRKTPWPFVMVTFISGAIAFVTWLVLGFAQSDPLVQIIGTVAVFIAVAATLLHYVLSCMRRHCEQLGHQHYHGHSRQRDTNPQLHASS
jgi:hypothetical protein